MPLSLHTPVLESLPLSKLNGTTVHLKMEALQPSGSFKARGIGYACEHHAARGARRFMSSSGGNAGLAVAYAGRKLGIPVVVVVPEPTSERAKQLLAAEDAEVIVHGASWAEANQLALAMKADADAFVHPFDDPLLWQGHATMIDEVVADGVRPDAVVLSVGGGGLLAGVDEGLRRNGLGGIPIYAAETEGMASYSAALKAGGPVEMPTLRGIATTLGARRVCKRAFEVSRERPVRSVCVTDREAVDACLAFLDDHRVLVEPACGASLALLYGKKIAAEAHKNLLVIVCGGATATLNFLRDFREPLCE
ncbi:MAG: pyridoxal-phosphate dependent enzyme [Proteobacteria bacterium]|nr:pyridoxal-phosphate dependent enzyme [Pseudomonadota bacterium]